MQVDLIKDAYGIAGAARALSGGQGLAIKLGDYVVKPITNATLEEWKAGILMKLRPKDYRLSLPRRCKKGSFVFAGHVVYRYEPGYEEDQAIEEKLLAAEAFHKDLARISIDELPRWTDPWQLSHEIALGKRENPFEELHHLFALLPKTYKEKDQVIHGDLSGNILHDTDLAPLIIDFSPALGPVAYARALLICDLIAWAGRPLSDLSYLGDLEKQKEWILRSIIFRLGVHLFRGQKQGFQGEYKNFHPLIKYIKNLP